MEKIRKLFRLAWVFALLPALYLGSSGCDNAEETARLTRQERAATDVAQSILSDSAFSRLVRQTVEMGMTQRGDAHPRLFSQLVHSQETHRLLVEMAARHGLTAENVEAVRAATEIALLEEASAASKLPDCVGPMQAAIRLAWASYVYDVFNDCAWGGVLEPEALPRHTVCLGLRRDVLQAQYELAVAEYWSCEDTDVWGSP